MKIKGTLSNILDRTIDVMFVLAGILLLFAMLIISIGVGTRYLFGRPLGWAIEIVEYSLVYIAFFTAPMVLKRGAHVRMDLIFNRLGPRLQSMLNLITSSISMIICLILFGFGVRVANDLFRTHYTTPTILEIPKFIIIVGVFIGFAVLFIQFFIRTYNLLRIWKAPGLEKEGH